MSCAKIKALFSGVASVAMCALLLVGSGSSSVPVLTEADNTYASYTPSQFSEIAQSDLDAKKICYKFEGSYTEGFQTLVNPTYMTLYLYDGCLRWGFPPTAP